MNHDLVIKRAIATLDEAVNESGYKQLTPYKNSQDKIHFVCPNGHDYFSTACNFRAGKRCSICAGKSKDAARTEFKKLLEENGYKQLSEYKTARKNIKVVCDNGHIHNTTPTNFKRGVRCPHCKRRGGGYNCQKHGIFYLVRWTKDEHSFLKFGITSKLSIDDRIKRQSRYSDYVAEVVIARYYISGETPLRIESIIKSTMNTAVISEEQFGDGYTETVDDTIENIVTIHGLMNDNIYTKRDSTESLCIYYQLIFNSVSFIPD
ncbi:hypothetical protein KGV31_002138 [Vibrio parahaemolyticus]|nr:hypothetical protein [Vibrio parahaemolyticus]EHU0344282.1 hypothetical protein [Vibrio parahaemolyticus]EHU0354316.1 hypothetical protein [Vibrio parahaemolyticus]